MLAELGKTLVIIGGGIVILGGLLWLSSGTLKNFPLGRLPGDILIQNDNITFYFPLTTGILLSLGLSAVLWLWRLLAR
jgi:hypothetical protein